MCSYSSTRRTSKVVMTNMAKFPSKFILNRDIKWMADKFSTEPDRGEQDWRNETKNYVSLTTGIVARKKKILNRLVFIMDDCSTYTDERCCSSNSLRVSTFTVRFSSCCNFAPSVREVSLLITQKNNTIACISQTTNVALPNKNINTSQM